MKSGGGWPVDVLCLSFHAIDAWRYLLTTHCYHLSMLFTLFVLLLLFWSLWTL